MAITADQKRFLAPYDYILQSSGKKIRTKLVKAFNVWLNLNDYECEIVCDVIEMLHNASLLVDDIEDYSILRRGVPAAHLVFGNKLTINCANIVCLRALQKMINLIIETNRNDEGQINQELIKIYNETLLPIAEGQGMDIYFRDTQTCPTMEQYLDMIDKKTSALFSLGARLLQLLSKNKQDFVPLVRLIGKYFQIRDDYANLKFDEYAKNKSFCEDFTEGKYSFLIVHAITTHPEDKFIEQIVKQRPTDLETKLRAVKHMEKLGTFAYTEKVLEDLREQIKQELTNLNQNPNMLEILDSLFIKEKQ